MHLLYTTVIPLVEIPVSFSHTHKTTTKRKRLHTKHTNCQRMKNITCLNKNRNKYYSLMGHLVSSMFEHMW